MRWKSVYLAFALVVEKIGHLAEWHDVRESLDTGGSANVQKRDAFRIDGAFEKKCMTLLIRFSYTREERIGYVIRNEQGRSSSRVLFSV